MPTPAKSHGCTWHWLSEQDLAEIAGLVTAEEYFGESTNHHDLPGLEKAVADDSVRRSQTGVVLRKPSGTLIAYAWIKLPRDGDSSGEVQLHGGCHPAWRDEGVQETLLQWEVERSLEWHVDHAAGSDPLELVVLTSQNNQFLAAPLLRHGFHPQRWYHAMRRSLAEPLHDLPGDPGVDFHRFGPEWSEAVREAYNQTVARPQDALETEAWSWALRTSEIRDDLSWVAVDGDRLVGWALNAQTRLAGELAGWTEYLGGTPAHRAGGLYHRLLARSQQLFVQAGLPLAGIGIETDSSEGARPYRDLGYTGVDTVVWYVAHPTLDTIGPAHTEEQMGS